MVYFHQFETSDNMAYNISCALDYCKRNKVDKLVFDRNIYRIKRNLASETMLSISNHSHPGLKRICFLLEGFEQFTIDGSGSEFVFEDVLIPFVIQQCSGVTLRNFSIRAENTRNAQFTVINSGDSWAEIRPEPGCRCYVCDGVLYAGEQNGVHDRLVWFDEIDGKTGWFALKTADYALIGEKITVQCADKDGVFRIEGLARKLGVGNTLICVSETREACGIFLNDSKNTKIEHTTLYSGVGMGVIAQNCSGVLIDDMQVRAYGKRKFSLNADATHFVHCKGDIVIRNSHFELQLDDACNIHSLYLKIVSKKENSVIAHFGNYQAKGIEIIRKDSVVQIVDPKTQLSKIECRVKAVKMINLDYAEIEFFDNICDVEIGDLIDEVSWKPNVLIENCVIQNNRARGLLIASGGTTVIQDNVFRTPGTAILFESDGEFWLESGGVNHVIIRRNTFEYCKYGGWGDAVIHTVPRKKTEVDRYYHRKIEICDNSFRKCFAPPAIINNSEEVIFLNNRFEQCCDNEIETEHCGKIILDVN